MKIKDYFKSTQVYQVWQRQKFEKKLKSHVCDIICNDPDRIVDVQGTYEIMGDLPPVMYHISETSLHKNYVDLGNKVSKRFVSDLYGTVTELKNLTQLLRKACKQK